MGGRGLRAGCVSMLAGCPHMLCTQTLAQATVTVATQYKCSGDEGDEGAWVIRVSASLDRGSNRGGGSSAASGGAPAGSGADTSRPVSLAAYFDRIAVCCGGEGPAGELFEVRACVRVCVCLCSCAFLWS